ncbi:putative integral membrane protein [Methyloglobulus morosus KoM1]|uniref:Putative integral membrane protein n=1 Tax=Methyloglobulus morosus KoM1 TaxID=1116472 RepID=V5C455_9GAMM|nr:VanZ family protein [Methyloglobulus morosus]ESS71523.1 putative integral membrane protein [Methyloglobulus morosus KoM1]
MTKAKNSHRPSIFFILLCVGWLTALFIESSQPPLPVLEKVHGLDKVAHFFAFGVLGFLVCCVSLKFRERQVIPLLSLPLMIVTLFGITEEGYQMFVPGRAASLLDLLADIFGAVCAIILVNRVAPLFFANKHNKLT